MQNRKLHRYVSTNGPAMRRNPGEAALQVAENEGWLTVLPATRTLRTSGARPFGRRSRPH